MISNQEIFKNLSILKSRIEHDFRLKMFYFLSSTFMTLLGGFIILSAIMIYAWVRNQKNLFGIFELFWVVIIPWSILYGRDYLITLPKKILDIYVNDVIDLLKSVQAAISQWFQIEDICKQIEYIGIKIADIQSKRKYLWIAIMKESTRKSMSNSFILITKWVLLTLTDLRSDLSIRLAEQKSTLKSAKSEVEKNITWTTELNQVSELQRTRLDRQIEQFEELQRVLVKV